MDPLRDARVRSPSAGGRRAAPTEAGEGNWCVGATFDGLDRETQCLRLARSSERKSLGNNATPGAQRLRKTASEFFGLRSGSGATTLVDTRLRNRSQLAGFAKRDDLAVFLGGALSWEQYAVECVRLSEARRVEEALGRAELTDAVLLCNSDP